MNTKLIRSFGLGAEHHQLLHTAVPSFFEFADRHAYDVDCTDPPEHPRPASWLKVPALIDALERYETVLWLDADTVIVDPSDDIEAPQDAWHALVEHHTQDGHVPNCGVWLLRRPMIPVLQQIWDMTEFMHHGWWEQAALIRWMENDATGRRPNGIWERTYRLDPGWNVHIWDRQTTDRPRIMHATMHPNRLQTMREWRGAVCEAR